jgi:hypothetical protein
VVFAVLITAIITIVLAKPALEIDPQMLPWPF